VCIAPKAQKNNDATVHGKTLSFFDRKYTRCIHPVRSEIILLLCDSGVVSAYFADASWSTDADRGWLFSSARDRNGARGESEFSRLARLTFTGRSLAQKVQIQLQPNVNIIITRISATVMLIMGQDLQSYCSEIKIESSFAHLAFKYAQLVDNRILFSALISDFGNADRRIKEFSQSCGTREFVGFLSARLLAHMQLKAFQWHETRGCKL